MRLTHWCGVVLVAAAWLSRKGPSTVHDTAGYALLALIALRLVWGAVGTRHARFGDFLRSPRHTWLYAMALRRGREGRHLGHNPLGGYMAVALWLTLLVTVGSGWLATTDRFWGVAWVERLHGLAADLVLILAAVHVAGVVFTSVRYKENLVAAMLHGRKAAEPQPPRAVEPPSS